jgi:glycine cleavage system regulatory protein
VSGPDRTGLLRDVCQVLADRGINIRRFELSTRVEFPPGDNPSEGLAGATTYLDLTFQTEMTRKAAAGLAACRAAIASLASPGPITCE